MMTTTKNDPPPIKREYQCDCDYCVSMCKHRPCWPTPDEIQGIIENGFGDNLGLDYYWVDDEREELGGRNVYIVAPAIVNNERQLYPYSPTGTCTFLQDGLCALHNKCKPFEGRVVVCPDKTQMDDNFSAVIPWLVRQWDTDKGRDVVRQWKEHFMIFDQERAM